MRDNIPPLISVIIPVYNGSKFLLETLTSLKNQTFSNFEVICVDDSSTDESLEILRTFALNDKRFKVFTKENGGMAAKAINYGLKNASGEYFMYSSQDDLFSDDLLDSSYKRITETGADAVVPQLILYHGEECLKKIDFNVRETEYTGREAFFLSLDWQLHGFVLWSRKNLPEDGFYEFGLNSDEYTTRMLFNNSKKVVFSSGIFYYRQNNPNAITQKWSPNLLDYIKTNESLQKFILDNCFPETYINVLEKAILHDLIRIKLILNKHRLKIEKQEIEDANSKIKISFEEHHSNFRKLVANGFLDNFKLKFQTYNYTTFTFYCKIRQYNLYPTKK